ncbi:hypothetical protein [Chitinophaga arvensicola]|uniref:Lipoprotein n=1 Tax=Chitinophaga arvensicola TaxID=29529 RepID=A0A1I0Q5G4_9BACT|nr:hypothetical protein [Chitinophaga arvensicola]SEW22033.1 hypothetical protein SAMN04488122_1231 [Chitinophaga arvensicola]
MKSYFSTNRVLAWTITGVAVATIFFACKKEITTDTAPNNQSDNNAIAASQHEAAVSAMYGGLFETVGQIAVEQGLFINGRKAGVSNTTNAVVTSCPVAELLDATSPTQWPKRVDIDFGDSCLDRYGVYRSGILHVIFSGPLFNANSTIVIESRGYKLNGKAVDGRFAISGATYSKTAGIQYTAEVTGGKVTLNDSTIVNYTSKRTIKQTAGFDQVEPLRNPADDVYAVEGTATISYVKGPVVGATATFTSQEALVKIDDCHHFVKGKLKVELDKVTGVIDYGNGKCTDPITITVGDKTKQIQL